MFEIMPYNHKKSRFQRETHKLHIMLRYCSLPKRRKNEARDKKSRMQNIEEVF